MDPLEDPIDPHLLLRSVKSPVRSTPPRTANNGMLVFNIHRDALSINPNCHYPRDWRDIKDGTFENSIKRLLITTVALCGLKQPNENIAHFDHINGVPRVSFMVEQLTSEENKTERWNIMGYRIWVFTHHPDFDLNKRLASLIETNAYINANEMKKSSQIPAWKDFSKHPYLCYRQLLQPKDWYDSIVSVYYSGNPSYIDDWRTLEPETDVSVSPIAPTNIFNAKNAMNLHVRGVNAHQRDITKYFDIGVGNTGSAFRSFPYPERVFKYEMEAIRPKLIWFSPLPDYLYSNFIFEIEELDRQGIQMMQNPDSENDQVSESDLSAEFMEHRQTIVKAVAQSLKEHIIERTGTNLSVLTGLDPEKTFAQNDDFIAERLMNEDHLRHIQTKYVPGTKEYMIEFNKYTDKAIDTFWRLFMTSEKVSEVTKHARRFFDSLHKEKKHFVSFGRVCKNLSLYGNLKYNMFWLFTRPQDIKSDFNLVVMLLLTSVTSWFYHYGARQSLMIPGPPGTGKSWKLDSLKAILFEGTIVEVGLLTDRAFQTEKDVVDIVWLSHEAPYSFLGIDSKGNKVAVDPATKDWMSKGFSSTVFFNMNKQTGKRDMGKISNRMQLCLLTATNEVTPSEDSALGQRNMIMTSTGKKGSDSESKLYEKSSNPSWAETAHLKKAIIDKWKILTLWTFIVTKAQMVKALPEVNLDTAKFLIRQILPRFKSNGIKIPSERKIFNYYKLCTSMTIMYAVCSEFFSELGNDNRLDSNGRRRSFNPSMLKNISKWLVTPLELAIDVFMTMETIWHPSLKYKILRDAAVCLANYNLDDVDNISFRKEKTANGIEEDYNYVQIENSSYTQIFSQISGIMTDERPGESVVKSAIIEAYGEVIESPTYTKTNRMELGQNVIPAALTASTEKKLIPMVRMDTTSDKKKRISIAIAVLQSEFGDLAKIIKEAVSHVHTRERECAISRPFTREVREGNIVRIKEYMNLFQVMNIKPSQNEIIIKNVNAINPNDKAILTITPEDTEDIAGLINPLHEIPSFYLDRDIDDITFEGFWRDNGLICDEGIDAGVMIALPHVAQMAVNEIRKSDAYKDCERGCIKNYPIDAADNIDAELALRNNEDNRNTRPHQIPKYSELKRITTPANNKPNQVPANIQPRVGIVNMESLLTRLSEEKRKEPDTEHEPEPELNNRRSKRSKNRNKDEVDPPMEYQSMERDSTPEQISIKQNGDKFMNQLENLIKKKSVHQSRRQRQPTQVEPVRPTENGARLLDELMNS